MIQSIQPAVIKLAGAASAFLLFVPVHSVAAESLAWPRHQFGVSPGVLTVDIGAVANSGTVIPDGAGSERPNLYAPDSVDTTGGRVEYTYNSGRSLPRWLDWSRRSSNLTFTVAWATFDDDDSAFRSEPAGGNDVGFLYQKFNPPSQRIGYFPGAAGLESSASNRVDYGRLEAGMKWLRAVDWLPANTRLIPGIRFAWTQLDYYVESRDTFDPALISPQEYSNRRDQHMQEDIFELRLGARLERLFGGQGQFSVFGDLGLNYYFLKSNLSSYEFPIIAGNRRNTFQGEGERDGFVGFDMGLGIGWLFTDHWSIKLSGNYSPDVPTATIRNPVSAEPGGPFTTSDTSKETHASVLLGLSYGFGSR